MNIFVNRLILLFYFPKFLKMDPDFDEFNKGLSVVEEPWDPVPEEDEEKGKKKKRKSAPPVPPSFKCTDHSFLKPDHAVRWFLCLFRYCLLHVL